MLRATLNEAVPLQTQLSDESTTLYAQAKIYDSDGNLRSTLNLPHIEAGLYGSEYTFTAEGYYTVVYKLYTDSGYSSASTEYGISAEMVEVSSDKTNIIKILGLTHDNIVWDSHIYDANNNLLTSRLRQYNTKTNADAAGTTGLLNTWVITATYSNNRLTSYTMTKT